MTYSSKIPVDLKGELRQSLDHPENVQIFSSAYFILVVLSIFTKKYLMLWIWAPQGSPTFVHSLGKKSRKWLACDASDSLPQKLALFSYAATNTDGWAQNQMAAPTVTFLQLSNIEDFQHTGWSRWTLSLKKSNNVYLLFHSPIWLQCSIPL